MEKIGLNNQIEKKFQDPQEEIEYLRKQIQERERQIESAGSQPDREKVIEHAISDYKQNKPEEVLEKGHIVPEKNREEIVLQLQPEEHDDKISELYGMLEEKGVLNTIDIVEKMNDPHISDDFHRFLVQYIREGYTVKGLKDKSPLAKSLKRILFEITLPDRGGEDREQNLQQLISMMEQFYYGMLHISEEDKDDYLTLEIANSVGSRQFVFYISVSLKRRGLFEKQFLSFFPNARILEQKDDFNVFNPKGVSVGSYAILEKTPAKPLRSYDEFQNDPLKVLLNVFSKLDTTKEGAGIQLVFKPSGSFYQKNYSKVLSRLEKGEKPGDELYMRNTTADKFMNTVSGLFSGGFSSKKDDKEKEEAPKIDSSLVELIKKKIDKPIISTNIRIVSSGETLERAKSILSDIESAFNQFDDPTSNQINFANLKDRHMKKLFKDFTFRSYTPSIELPLNLAEVATIMHFPQEKTSISSQLKSNNFATAAAPVNLAEEGILLGINEHQGTETDVYLSKEDRLRHLYTIGQTGTGKTNFLKSLIIQDIQNGEGVCMIDPHGNDIQDVLANIPPERYDDVIYFDPANTENPMALNMLEYDKNFPEQKIFVVNELFGIFMKLYGSNPESMGPMFEQYFRNAAGLVVEDPESGNTLLDISRVLADEKYRKLKLSRCNNPIIKQFWEEVAGKAGGEASLANIVPYITSKFDVFLANDIMRPIVAQEKSSFNFRDVMDNKKILLVNLSKGRLGDINSNLIGLIIVGKILMAALSRADSYGKDFPPFYLYIDEFQNITTDSISTILSEARKYKLSLNVAHQFIAQLDEKISDAVFGNVGSMTVFRVGSEDAQFFEKQYEPTFGASDIMNIDNFNCYAKILANGVPVKPFSFKALKSPDGNPEIVEQLKQLSYQKYGKPRSEIEAEIAKKYKKEEPKENEENPFKSLR
ncbi:DUF87 domain-containing protein [Candidatus Parcubacteria bacterium]|nr:DUF87 domain-containing protein [Candidatus Parcubacteria bacterium]